MSGQGFLIPSPGHFTKFCAGWEVPLLERALSLVSLPG